MRAVVIGVGDELLSGLVVNTNAAMIGEQLLGIGVPVAWSACIGDDEDAIVGLIRRAASDADVVVVTGGLGPTHDDRTREAIARLLGTDLVRDERIVDSIRERFRAFGREMHESNARQADIPAGATAIENPYGTAPGIRAEIDGSVVFAVPGVPGEARRMLAERIVPELGGRSATSVIRSVEVRCVGIPESDLAGVFADLTTMDNPAMAFLPGGGEVRLRFVATALTDDDAIAMLVKAEATVRERVGVAAYGTGDDTLESVVAGMLTERRLTVGTAESCTAGLVAGRLGSVVGASAWLRGGLVTYQTDLKTSALGVRADVIDRHGPVSEEVAREMALGAREKLGCDVAVSVTCAAGPDPQDGAPPGRTFLACAGPGETIQVVGLTLPGDREQIRQFATTFAIDLLRRTLLQS